MFAIPAFCLTIFSIILLTISWERLLYILFISIGILMSRNQCTSMKMVATKTKNKGKVCISTVLLGPAVWNKIVYYAI